MKKEISQLKWIRILFLTFIYLLISNTNYAQSYTEWMIKYNYIPNFGIYNIHTDDAGFVYIFSEYSGTTDVTFTPELSLASAGGYDAFLAKYDAQGKFIWAVDFKNKEEMYAMDFALDKSGNIILSFEYYGEINVQGQNIPGLSLLSHAIIKINADGKYVWSQGTGRASASCLTSDKAGNFYLFRFINQSEYVLKFGSISYNNPTPQLVMLKFDTDKNVLALKPICNQSYKNDARIAKSDDLNNIYLSISITEGPKDKLYFNNNTNLEYALSNPVIVKINSDGLVQWSRRMGIEGNQVDVNGMTIDKNNNLYFCGGFNNTFTIDQTSLTSAGSLDNFIASYTPNGTLVYAKRFGTENNNYFRTIQYSYFNNQIYFIATYRPLSLSDKFTYDDISVAPWTANLDNHILGRMDLNGVGLWGISISNDQAALKTSMSINKSGQIIWSGRSSVKKLHYKVVGASFDSPIDVGNISLNSFYTDTKNNSPQNFFWNDVENLSDDIFYTFYLTEPAMVIVSTCGSGLADTYLVCYNSKKEVVCKNDDNGPACATMQASFARVLYPGRYYVASEGYSSNAGNITTTIKVVTGKDGPEGSTVLKPIDLGDIHFCYNFKDFNSNRPENHFGDDIGTQSDDFFYKFTLLQTTTVKANTCGSGVGDTYLYLLDAKASIIFQNDDNGPLCSNYYQASFDKVLEAGTYYIGIEGYGTNTGDFTILINFNTGCREGEEDPSLAESQNNTIRLYPNPASEFVTVNIPDSQNLTYLQLTDILGNQVLKSKDAITASELNVSALTPGMYIINLVYPDKTMTEKLQINR